MLLTLEKTSALRATRYLRAERGISPASLPRTDVLGPDPTPRRRWTSSAIDLSPVGQIAFDERHPLHVAVESQERRPKLRGVEASVRGGSVPRDAYLNVGGGVAISSPELLFAELAEMMSPEVLLLTGLELCGSFSRDPVNPRDGNIRFDLPHATSADAIRRFLEESTYIRELSAARLVAPYLVDNAWSPMEAIVAVMALLPHELMGYGLGPLVLNPRKTLEGADSSFAQKATRVPDIMFGDTGVGINYDGGGHWDMKAVAEAAAKAAQNPDSEVAARELADVIRTVRRKYADDRRRDRDLWLQGMTVFPATSFDLYDEGGMDRLMGQVIRAIERNTGRNMQDQFDFLERPWFKKRRQKVLWSLLPGQRGRELSVEQPPAHEPREVVDVVVTISELGDPHILLGKGPLPDGYTIRCVSLR